MGGRVADCQSSGGGCDQIDCINGWVYASKCGGNSSLELAGTGERY